MAPVRPGHSALFWRYACGVGLTPEAADGTWSGRAYLIDDAWVAYDQSHYHGSDIYYVPVAEVLADFDAVVDRLQQAAEQGRDTPFAGGYVNWRDDEGRARFGGVLLEARMLLRSIEQERMRRWAAQDVELLAYRIAQEQQFWQRWQRANWYWANIVFEWTFLSGLLLFVCWPGIRQRSAVRWAIHAAFFPLLFLLPAYLGYATIAFTSAAPGGGIFYSFLLTFCWGGTVTEFDAWLLTRLPQVLEPLSVPIGSPMAWTGMGMPGPTSAIVAGIVMGGLLFAVSLTYRRWSHSQSRVQPSA